MDDQEPEWDGPLPGPGFLIKPLDEILEQQRASTTDDPRLHPPKSVTLLKSLENMNKRLTKHYKKAAPLLPLQRRWVAEAVESKWDSIVVWEHGVGGPVPADQLKRLKAAGVEVAEHWANKEWLAKLDAIIGETKFAPARKACDFVQPAKLINYLVKNGVIDPILYDLGGGAPACDGFAWAAEIEKRNAANPGIKKFKNLLGWSKKFFVAQLKRSLLGWAFVFNRMDCERKCEFGVEKDSRWPASIIRDIARLLLSARQHDWSGTIITAEALDKFKNLPKRLYEIHAKLYDAGPSDAESLFNAGLLTIRSVLSWVLQVCRSCQLILRRDRGRDHELRRLRVRLAAQKKQLERAEASLKVHTEIAGKAWRASWHVHDLLRRGGATRREIAEHPAVIHQRSPYFARSFRREWTGIPAGALALDWQFLYR